ncbi:MAG: hypothetical protein Q9197_001302 [Variospora fuerteventurae]
MSPTLSRSLLIPMVVFSADCTTIESAPLPLCSLRVAEFCQGPCGLPTRSPDPRRSSAQHAYTVRYIPKDEKPRTKLKGTIYAIDHVPHLSHILFITGPYGAVNASYGGLVSRRAKIIGVNGTIVDGPIRDIQKHRDVRYPVR